MWLLSKFGALFPEPQYCILMEGKVILRTDPAFISKINVKFYRHRKLSFHPDPSHHKKKWLHTSVTCRGLKVCIHNIVQFRRTNALFVLYHLKSKWKKAPKYSIYRWLRYYISEAYKQKATIKIQQPLFGYTPNSFLTTATLISPWVLMSCAKY